MASFLIQFGHSVKSHNIDKMASTLDLFKGISCWMTLMAFRDSENYKEITLVLPQLASYFPRCGIEVCCHQKKYCLLGVIMALKVSFIWFSLAVRFISKPPFFIWV